MRPSTIRARFRQGKAARFACMYYPTAMMPAYAAKAGYDAIWLETEHNTWDRRELQRMIALHHLAGIDCIVRTGSRNATELYHLLEDGAAALMIPLVNSAAEARQLVQAVKFPPLGQRGLDGAGLDNDFFLQGTEGYPAAANNETSLILQIETPEAVDAIEEIAAVKGVDGLFIGPGDLALRLQTTIDWTDAKMAAAQAKVAAAANKHGVAWGRPARNAEDIAAMAKMGARLIAHGSDFGGVASILAAGGKTIAEGLR
ncbi:MAG: hypothetical protein JNG83_00290 [Opitutaceae bacterium]|nr:hypothetical protein [Opitutaceae bacterium]